MSAKQGRSYEKNFEVAAPAEAVWKAITEGDELTRWFCVQASCEPGTGGLQHIDWGGGAKATQVVTHWEPGAHLRTEAVDPKRAESSSEPYAIDWYLEHEGDVTRVRMVASGFGDGPEWDHEYDGTFHGWDMFHQTMKHYLEHHRGKPSANIVLYAMLAVPTAEAWARLMSAEGLLGEGRADNLAPGAPFKFKTSQGDVLSGVVRSYVPGKTLSAMVENLNNAILNLEASAIPGHGHFLYLSLVTWGLPQSDVDALRTRLKAVIYGLFPQKTDTPASSCAPSQEQTSAAQPT